MGTRFTESDLQKLGLQNNSDGTYSKKKTVPQPREIKNNMNNSRFANRDMQFRKISLKLFGIPMPKQSVRSTNSGHHYQPQKAVDRLKDYQKQIRDQLPKNFQRFETCVFVRKMHFMYPPLKAFHKEKGKMEAIRNGTKFYKNTVPDLPDNLKKLCNDAMSGLVYRDDCIIVGEDNIRKYYSVGGCIIIELEGY